MAGFLTHLKQWGVPGFRSGKPIKQVLASVGYIVILVWVVGGLNGKVGLTVFGLVVLAVVLLVSNAWNIRSRLPLLGSSRRQVSVAGWAIVAALFVSTWAWAAAETPTSSRATSLKSGTGGVGGGTLSTTKPESASTPSPKATSTPTSTPTPTTPTPSPTSTPTPAPTPRPATPAPIQPAPVQPAPVQAATVAFVNAPLSARHGTATTLIVKTSPNTGCSIEVDYKSGPSTAQGLGPKTSDAAGNVSWTWIVGSRTTLGQWPIYVTCGSASGQTHITVT